MCPLCVFCAYQTHPLKINNRPFHKKDFLFIFEGQHGKWFPLTDSIFSTTLHKICTAIGLLRVNKSNFKIGVLTELWEASVKQVISFKPDARFFLQVADHRTDYHANYLIPDLVMIATALQEVRVFNLGMFIRRITMVERRELSNYLHALIPFQVTNTSPYISPQKADLKPS